MKPLLSVIVPVYNMEKYLPECLQSLERQKFSEEVEILLIDDGSTDKSLVICNAFASHNSIMRVIHQANSGVAATRNKGLHIAKGRYIAWVDPDDYVTDDWWQVIRPVLMEGSELVYFDMYMLMANHLTEIHFDSKSRVITREEWIRELVSGNRIKSHLWSKIFLRTLFDHNKIFNEQLSYCEDYEVLHRITWPIKKCVYLHNPLYVYRQHDESIVHEREKLISNAALSIQLNKERIEFYHARGIATSNSGLLNAELSYCLLCCQYGKNKLKQEERALYKQSLLDVRHNKWCIYFGCGFFKRDRLKAFLLLHHLLGVRKYVKWV